MTLYKRWRNLDLSVRILIGLAAGIFTGLFFGEPAGMLQPLGDIYIRLMQMTVLPYLITSLVIAFGQLEVSQAKRLAIWGGALLAVVWAFTGVVLVLFPATFPEFTSATFYSQALIEQRPAISFTDIYFTHNPFDSLSRNVVPAIVLFSSLVGVGVMGLPDKDKLLAPLRIWNQAIVRVTHFVIGLTPIGVFALASVIAGTLTTETWLRLEVYFLVFGAAALLLAFWILPLMVTAATPFSYREVTGVARDALLMAFVTNSAFIVLPLLIDRCKELLARHGLLEENSDSATEVLIPVMFNFPNAGKLLTLLFVPFAAWLSGAPMVFGDYPTLLAAGIPSYFAKAQTALPFLLDLFALPQDLFDLYIPTTILTGKFDSLVAAMNLIVFALLGSAAMAGFLRLRRGRVLAALAAIAGGTVAAVLVLRLLLGALIDTSYQLDEVVQSMHNAKRHSGTIVHRDAPPPVAADAPKDALERVRRRGTLRIGYDPDNLPMSFFNRDDELVGFDVELGEELASAMGLRAEFVPIRWPALPTMLQQGVIDVMPGMWYRPYWFSRLQLSEPYFTGTIALVTRDHRRQEFQRVEQLQRSEGLTIGVPLDSEQISTSMEYYFAGSDVRFQVLEFWKPFFEGRHPEIDAFLMPAEHAAAWTLLYPHFTVVVPQPDPVRLPSAFGVATDALTLRRVVDEWTVFAREAGLVDQHYRYWVLGKGAETRAPRWSILRDVLGWKNRD
ncbi:cation:dicarboxylate symporter family transporter [Parahaliea mediterranea]|uniref:Cation:dicarboxylase symporter family transporter n=1 Tax=Parahaliea mediterranea TaxID=651086 RepID=A0A939DHA3_9GAMM|nr:cation:dicarboxylase symporter family transporter [Parahaliea mediterranea]MBN7798069.1 cation:dicarboxylase symporter family transporter [Parahaliea mediterranea]